MLHFSMFLIHFSHLGLFRNSVPTTIVFMFPSKRLIPPTFCWVSIKCRQNKIPVHFEQKSRCLQFVSVLFQLTWDSGNMELHTSHLVAPNPNPLFVSECTYRIFSCSIINSDCHHDNDCIPIIPPGLCVDLLQFK